MLPASGRALLEILPLISMLGGEMARPHKRLTRRYQGRREISAGMRSSILRGVTK